MAPGTASKQGRLQSLSATMSASSLNDATRSSCPRMIASMAAMRHAPGRGRAAPGRLRRDLGAGRVPREGDVHDRPVRAPADAGHHGAYDRRAKKQAAPASVAQCVEKNGDGERGGGAAAAGMVEGEEPPVVGAQVFDPANVTFQFNFGVLVSRYNVYIPDLLFFGKSSTTDSADRSPEFQAWCVAAALSRLGVARCDVVGFSYGGMVAFKLAEERPDLVRLGARSSADLLMPETVKGLKALFSVSIPRRSGAAFGVSSETR